jgi:hypothetical protein
VHAEVDAFLGRLDRIAPGWVTGCHLVGSTAFGAWRANRSDIDLVVTVAAPDPLDAVGHRYRRTHSRQVAGALARLRYPLICSAVYVREADLSADPLTVTPVASHVGFEFEIGTGFNVNPVTWWELAHKAVTVRGALPDVPVDDAQLRDWCRGNLTSYWASWRPGRPAAFVRHLGLAWGPLGAPRLHATIRTGGVLTKEQAGEYALDVFDPEWRPVVQRALAYWRGSQRPIGYVERAHREQAMAFIQMVVADA